MEALVATGIFAILVLMVLGIYSSILVSSQQTISLTKIQQEAQLIMQVLAKKIRTSRVNYDYVGYTNPITNPETNLALVDLLNDEYVFSLSGGKLVVSVNGSADKQISSNSVNVDDLKFYFNPTTNPFVSLDNPPDSEPYVTIVLTISSSKGRQSNNLVIQQTIPQRSGGVVN